jgi:ABC-2 type transport system ATP-binding protein
MPTAAIKVVNVTKRFGKKTVLNDVSFEINSGEIFGIIGMSGSGKTTLLNPIIGFLQPEYGDVLFKLDHLLSFAGTDGQYRSVFSSETEVKKSFGFAAQMPSLYLKLNCVENLEYFGNLYNLSKDIRKTNIDILLNLMDISESRNVLAGHFSGGMLKRLDIACALIHDPKILILDEPTADLDPLLRKQMWTLIKEINRKGTTIILSSHFLDEIDVLCDRVGILVDGRIMRAGTPSDIKNYYYKDQEIIMESTPGKYNEIIKKLESKKKQLNISSMSIRDNKLVVYTPSPEGCLHEVLHIVEELGEIMLDVIVEKPSLQEVLEKLRTERKK